MELSTKLKLPQVKREIVKAKEVMNRTVIKSLVCELRPRLCTGNVFIQTAQKLAQVDASSDAGHVILSLAGIGWCGMVAITCPHHFSLNPSGFQIDDDSLSFTVVLKPVDKRVGSLSAQVLRITQTEADILSTAGNLSVPLVPCQPKCRECDSLIWKDLVWKFERVLELPSTPIEEVVGEWFCHGHGDSLSLVPKVTDCFHDHLSTVVYLKDSAPGMVSCPKCQSWLGSIDKSSMCKLWGFTVKWEGVDGSPWLNLPSSPYEAFLVAIRLILLEEGILKPITKILIESQNTDGDRNWLLLSVLNGDLKVLQPCDEVVQEVTHGEEKDSGGKSKEVLEVGWSALFTEKGSDISEVSQGLGMNFDSFPFRVPLCPQKMKRVLFKEEKDFVDTGEWGKNSGIAAIKVAAPVYYAGICHLKKWNQLLPLGQRLSDGFTLSYLEL